MSRSSADVISAAFDVIMRGEGAPSQVAALLMALRVKGETADEVAGVVHALRRAMIVLPRDDARTISWTRAAPAVAL